MNLPVSIIIPTLNEENYLPKLLDSLQQQTMLPSEIIIADAFSTDRTREIARTFGCNVIDGGMPAKARNNGAQIATQPLLLFLDADVILPSTFLERTITEMKHRGLDVATCYVRAISHAKRDHHMHNLTNLYLKSVNRFYPHASGFCIFAKKSLHEKIGGFDEELALAEDHNYVKRAKKIGKFAYLHSEKIPVSVRRLADKGRWKLALMYAYVELYRLFGREIKKHKFAYKFGHHK